MKWKLYRWLRPGTTKDIREAHCEAMPLHGETARHALEGSLFTRARSGLFAGPADVAAGFPQLAFHIGELLLESFDLLLLGSDFGVLVVDVFA